MRSDGQIHIIIHALNRPLITKGPISLFLLPAVLLPVLVVPDVQEAKRDHLWCVPPPYARLSSLSSSKRAPRNAHSGGLNTCSRTLAALLVPPDGSERLVEVRLLPAQNVLSLHRIDPSPLAQNLRIVDKYSVAPPTT